MVSEEKIKKVKKQLKMGIPEGEIRESLKHEGYSIEDIKKIFQPHKYDMRSWYFVFAIILLSIGLFTFFKDGNLLILILSALLFLAYYKEIERLKKQ